MLEPSRTGNSTLPARLLTPWPASRHSSLVTHHCLNQSLAKQNRKPSQLFENNQQQPILIASFSAVLSCADSIRARFFCIEAKRDLFPAGI